MYGKAGLYRPHRYTETLKLRLFAGYLLEVFPDTGGYRRAEQSRMDPPARAAD